jgi:ubiquinone/menaquinone biosynthesis C-methylase UbiE
MSSDKVGQSPVLNQIFAETVAEFCPLSMAVLGCSTGNGFEHIDPDVTQRVVGIDINPDYLNILEQRHRRRLTQLELVCADIASCRLETRSFDLVHGALIFEYVEPERVLPGLATWLRAGGVLSVVLQLPSPTSNKVSETPYRSLRSLGSIMHLVQPVVFKRIAGRSGLSMLQSREIDLRLGKKFHVATYRKAWG